MNQGHIHITIKDRYVKYEYANVGGAGGITRANGSNPHDGSVVDAERQVDYFLKLFKPKTQEIHFEIL